MSRTNYIFTSSFKYSKRQIYNQLGLPNSDEQHFVKFLGIHVESSLGWQTHINHVAKKISRGLYMLRILKSNISNESLLSVYLRMYTAIWTMVSCCGVTIHQHILFLYCRKELSDYSMEFHPEHTVNHSLSDLVFWPCLLCLSWPVSFMLEKM